MPPLPEPALQQPLGPATPWWSLCDEDLQKLRDGLVRKYATGASWVRYADGSGVGYADLPAVIGGIDRELLRRAGTPPVTTILVASSKGLCE